MQKLMIVPWFGPLPGWFPHWKENVDRLQKYGYDLLMPTDLAEFKRRVADKLGVMKCPVEYGKAKVHDYRATFGVLYAEEIKGYDFYGHTDLDCAYGQLDKWVTDDMLSRLDVHSNHHSYVCGPWTLYRNTDGINNLFRCHTQWREELESETTSGWVEREFSRLVEHSGLRYKYTFWQGKNPHDDMQLRWRGDALYDGADEIMMHHFRHTKRWPPCLIKS